MYVQFCYNYNMSYQDKFNEQCDKIELFLFNSDNVLVQRIENHRELSIGDKYKLPLYLAPGTYTIVSWFGHKDSYTFTTVTPQRSTKEELILKLNDNNGLSNKPLESLWNGVTTTFTISQAYGHTEEINLIKNTNRIQFTLTSLDDDIYADDIEIKLTAANSSYSYNNELADNKQITYLPFEQSNVNKNSASFTIDMLRLIEGEDVYLTIKDKHTQKSLLPKEALNLTEFLLKTKPTTMTNQEYLDREDLWKFDLYTASYFVAIMIQINEWTVWTQDNEL